ncbi:hypothetical protein RIF29_29170 [Crotalaria pallida]|uniref:Uncharacterized protein n=1 Tax=Crotalaria pallida TaxID=3830 RepID=A0AAN9EGE0_CROPI
MEKLDFVFFANSGSHAPSSNEPPDRGRGFDNGGRRWASFKEVSFPKPRRDLLAEKLGRLESCKEVSSKFLPSSSMPGIVNNVTASAKPTMDADIPKLKERDDPKVANVKDGKTSQEGNSGGLWVLAPNDSYVYSVVDSVRHAISVEVSKGGSSWLVTAIYASPTPAGRHPLWDYLVNFRGSVSVPWLMLGDFNDISHPSEVKRGNFYSTPSPSFNNMMMACNIVDLGNIGCKFSWVHN